MSTELDQQYNKNVWEVGEKLTGKVMMRQVHLLTFVQRVLPYQYHDYWCIIIIIIIVIIIINSLRLVLFPLIEPGGGGGGEREAGSGRWVCFILRLYLRLFAVCFKYLVFCCSKT